jgi:Lon protease-like protein
MCGCVRCRLRSSMYQDVFLEPVGCCMHFVHKWMHGSLRGKLRTRGIRRWRIYGVTAS